MKYKNQFEKIKDRIGNVVSLNDPHSRNTLKTLLDCIKNNLDMDIKVHSDKGKLILESLKKLTNLIESFQESLSIQSESGEKISKKEFTSLLLNGNKVINTVLLILIFCYLSIECDKDGCKRCRNENKNYCEMIDTLIKRDK